MGLSQVFIKILNMSLTASYCIIIVIALRFLLRKQPKLLSYFLWSVVLFRLICPFSLSSGYSLLRINTDIISNESLENFDTDNADVVGQNGANNGAHMLQIELNDKEDIQLPVNEDVWENGKSAWTKKAFDIASMVWLLGIALLICYSIVTMLRVKDSLKDAVWIEKNIYEAKGIGTPFVFGIIRPNIYLPTDIKEEEKKYVLEHEKVHIARKDYLIKILAYAAACMHWFNPLVWAAFILMENDMEMSCDEAVIKKLGENIKKEYSLSLLSLSCERTLFQGSPLAFGEGKVKGRIKNILSYRKRALLSVLLAVVVLVIIGIGLALNPAEENEVLTDNQEAEPETGNSDGENVENNTELSGIAETDADAVKQLVEQYAEAVCNRDGNTIASLYIDEETALVSEENMLLEKAGDGYTYGYSSPWPIDYRYIIDQSGQQADIWFYAWTSDPHIAVWKEEVQYIKSGEEYYIENVSMRFMDAISSKEEFDDAYLVNNEYQFVDYQELGFVDAVNYQINDATSSSDNTVYAKPESAAEHILNLVGGEGRVEGNYTSQAMVRYTFADGSEVMIPMCLANQENSGTEGGNSQNQEIWVVDTAVWNAGAP